MSDRNVALLGWLALEREAVWFYPYAGARVDEIADRARDSLTAHRTQRDALLGVVEDDSTRPAASYDVGPITTVAEAEAAAQSLERRIQAACLTLIRVSGRADRDDALTGVRRAAIAEITWGATPRAFPGLDS